MLTQRQVDLIGLGLIALGVFMATVMYFDWAGGKVGEGMADGVRFALGAVGYIVPVALIAAGAILVLRPMLPTTRPFVPGALCLFAALTLALAAGSGPTACATASGTSPSSRSAAAGWARPSFG